MKTQKLFLVPLCFLLLSACGPKSADTSPSSGGGDTSDTSPSSQDPEKLNAPALSLNTDKNGLTWAAVEGAVSYSISVNEGEATSVTTPGYAFEEVAGLYAVSVVAVASDTSLNSDPAQYSYTTAYTALGP